MKSSKYILCIDDDEDDCLLLKEAVSRLKNDVVFKFSKSGDQAIQFLSGVIKTHELPELIILDVNMPGMDGKATLREIRKILTSSIPVFFLTTTPPDAEVLAGEKNGITSLSKPTNMAGYDEIAKTVLSLIEN